MSTKAEGDSCYEKASSDEPIFVLRAQDQIAPIVVRVWAEIAEGLGTPLGKVNEARGLARRMEWWADSHKSKLPD